MTEMNPLLAIGVACNSTWAEQFRGFNKVKLVCWDEGGGGGQEGQERKVCRLSF